MENMKEVKRDKFIFIGPRADESAKYYDIVISHGYDGDLVYVAWESAHKFGQRMTGPNVASYRDGVVFGEKARDAAIYIDQKREEVFSSLPVKNRKTALKEKMREHYIFAEEFYHVSFKMM